MNRRRSLSLSYKISGIYLLANLFIFFVDITLIFGINGMSRQMEMVYEDNSHLMELSVALDNVQDSMTEYLNSKSTDSLSDYYLSEQKYSELVSHLSGTITEEYYGRMQRNIKNMSEEYLSEVADTIDAKRGRNVEKYRQRYERATRLYDYVKDGIQSMNRGQFVYNSERFTNLAGGFRRFELFAVAVMFVVLIGSALVIIRVSGNLIAPLKALARSAEEVTEGEFDVVIPPARTNDEIGTLTTAFRKMLVSIREYIDKLRIGMEKERQMQEKELLMETHLKDAQLKYLQAQINPHFLFNTLNAGAQLAMMEGADRTYEYVQTVADFFRYNIKKTNELVDVGSEIDIVDNYIRILNVRFSGDIHYESQIDDRLLKVKMPGMILQPIVENAVNHGIREMGDRGWITLKVYRDGDRVYISVKDNGKGMSLEDIGEVLSGHIRERQQKGESNGIGMDNVIARLRLFCERDDVINIVSRGRGSGTEVIINIPFEHEDKPDPADSEKIV